MSTSNVNARPCPMCGARMSEQAAVCPACGERIVQMPHDPGQSLLLKSARRELLFSAAVWLAALTWSVGYCAIYGYHLKPEDLTFVFGMPSWIFYGVMLPWGICTAIAGVFAFGIMQDAELGEPEEAPPASEADDAAE